jgi:hypothetical protein
MITDHLHGIFYAAILIVFIPIAHFIFYPFVQLFNPVPSLQCHVAFVVEHYTAHMPVKAMHIFLVPVSQSQLLTYTLVVSQLLPPAPSLDLFPRPASTFGVKGGGSCGLFGPKRACRHHRAHSPHRYLSGWPSGTLVQPRPSDQERLGENCTHVS